MNAIILTAKSYVSYCDLRVRRWKDDVYAGCDDQSPTGGIRRESLGFLNREQVQNMAEGVYKVKTKLLLGSTWKVMNK